MRARGLLRVTDLGVTYGGIAALRHVTLVVPPGGMLAVTGPSGAGKSSLLWALAGAVPFTGTVELEGSVALVPQGNGLPSFLTAEENVLVPLLASGAAPAEARMRARDALTLVGLDDSAGHLVEELSGGQQQRVALARTLALDPRVLLADEPTSDLDAVNRQMVIHALRARADAGAIVVMATHDPEAAADLDAELGLEDGKMTWRRDPEQAGWS